MYRLVVSWLLLVAAYPQAAEVCCIVSLRVRTPEGHPIADAQVRLESGASRADRRTSPAGDCLLDLRTPGQYRVTGAAPGYEPQTAHFSIGRDETKEVDLVLTRLDSVTVEGRPDLMNEGAPVSEAEREQVRSLPERIADVRNALPLIPGVVRTPEGKLQIAGSPEYRSTFLVNSVDVTDPGTSGFGATVPIDVIETVQVYKSPFLAEYGRFSTAVVAVTTRRGGETWHYELNDPTPEFRIRSKHIRGIRGFTPRFAVTGPLVRNRMFFTGAGTFELRKRPVYPLAWPYNEEKSQRVNSYAQVDLVIHPQHLLTISAHAVPQRFNFRGLGFYTPQTAAPSLKGHEVRVAAIDRAEVAYGTFETTASASQVRTNTGAGPEPLTLTPVTSLGNYFFTSNRTSERVHIGEIWSAGSLRLAGTHAIRAGGSVARNTQEGSTFARSVQIVSGSGEALGNLWYRNSLPYRLVNYDGGIFVQDGWALIPFLRLDAGVRVDADRLARTTTVAPRLGVAWTPDEKTRTVVRGGIGWFYDKAPLNAFAFAAYPERLGFPNLLAAERGLAPHSRTWSSGVDHRLNNSVLLHAGFLHSRHRRLLTVQPTPAATVLSDTGSATTTEFEVSSKLIFYSGQTWVLSYTQTYGKGNLNVFDRFGGSESPEPLLRPDIVAGLPDIIPHRFLSWGVFPLPQGLQFAPVLEWRSGFPWSAIDERRQYAGVPNTRALPAFFSLDGRVSKDIRVRKHKVRLSFSMFNITDHGNYDAVRWNTADPQFGEVLGRRPRRFRLDFDWLF